MYSQYWRRRFFRLQGTKLTAYHEHTHQPRATINLSKASKLIDDKTSLVADPKASNPSSKSRRKSAFAEEDEGYQFIEEGFRVRFANGETIDFYADNSAQKDEWMKALAQTVGKQTNTSTAKWTEVVLAKEKADGKTKVNTPKEADSKSPSIDEMPQSPARNPSIRVQAPSRESSKTESKSMPGSPIKAAGAIPRKEIASQDFAPDVPPKGEDEKQGRPGTPPLNARTGHRDRKAVKSMIF